jgi:hypothetical protein
MGTRKARVPMIWSTHSGFVRGQEVFWNRTPEAREMGRSTIDGWGVVGHDGGSQRMALLLTS